MDIESQGGYQDDPAFEALSDRLADEVFAITAVNGRLWAYLKSNKLYRAVEGAADNRVKIRTLKPDIDQLSNWPDVTASQKFTQHKITREFARAFAEFQKIQKTLASQERQALRDRQSAENTDSQSLIELEDAHPLDNDPVLLQQQAFEEQLREDEVAYQQGLIQEREQEIEGIEQGIHELNDIFTSLSSVIQEQGQALDNIESNIYSVRDNTREGSRQLTKAARWQRSTIGRKLCMFMIIVVILLFLVLSAIV